MALIVKAWENGVTLNCTAQTEANDIIFLQIPIQWQVIFETWEKNNWIMLKCFSQFNTSSVRGICRGTKLPTVPPKRKQNHNQALVLPWMRLSLNISLVNRCYSMHPTVTGFQTRCRLACNESVFPTRKASSLSDLQQTSNEGVNFWTTHIWAFAQNDPKKTEFLPTLTSGQVLALVL